MSNAEDITAVRAELEASQEALAALQRNFDDFQESSRELEEELEAELVRVRAMIIFSCQVFFWFFVSFLNNLRGVRRILYFDAF